MATDDETPRGVRSLHFDPDKHTHCVLKAFNEFVEQYEFRYKAQYPFPPKHAIDNEISVWKSDHEDANPNPAKKAYTPIRLQQDWKAARTDAEDNMGYISYRNESIL